MRGAHSASRRSGFGSSQRRWSGSLAPIRSPMSPMPSTGMRTSRDFIGCAPFFPTSAPRADVAHGPPMTSLDGAPQARRRPCARRIMLSDFRSYGELDLKIEGRLVVLCGENGAGKTNLLEALSLFAPGRGLRRAELAECARVGGAGGFALSVEVDEDGERRQLGTGWSPGEGES